MTLTNKEGWPACLSDLCDCIKDAIFICIFSVIVIKFQCTGTSLSEVLIFTSTNPQYEDRLFIELQVQYMKILSSEHGENMFFTEIVFYIQNNFCTQHVLSTKKSF